MDGARDAHDRYRRYKNGKGSFDVILKNLPLLKNAPRLRVRMTCTPETVADLPAGIELLLEHGIRNLSVSPVMEANWTEDDLDCFAEAWRKVSAIYLHERLAGRELRIPGLSFDQSDVVEDACKPIREFGCGAAVNFLFVDIDGDLYPCHRYPGYFNRSPEVRIGHVATGLDRDRRAFFIEANRARPRKVAARTSAPPPDRKPTAAARFGPHAEQAASRSTIM
jgi:uncharacterized protein